MNKGEISMMRISLGEQYWRGNITLHANSKPCVIELEYCDNSFLNKPSKSFYMLKNTVFFLKIQISGKLFSNFKISKNNSGLKDAPRCQFLSPKTIS